MGIELFSCAIYRFLILLGTLTLTGCADGLFYYPDSVQYSDPSEAKLKFENLYFKSADGTKLHGWFFPAVGKEKGVVIHFHGNAQNITGHLPLVYWLPQEGYSLFMFDYRGYGKSEGKPDREGLHGDSVAAVNYVLSRKDISTENVFVLGQSLGGANAIDAVAMTKNARIKAVVIESTFISYQEIALEKARTLSSFSGYLASTPSLLTSDNYSPRDNIKKVSPIPILLFHGTDDQVIPLRHSQALYDQAGQPKELVIVPGGQHLEAFTRFLPTTKKRLLDFFAKNSAGT